MSLKALLLLSFVAVVAAGYTDTTDPAVLSDDMINEVNQSGTTWTAGRNEAFEGMVASGLKKLLGTISAVTAVPTVGVVGDLPDEFDARTKWSNCIGSIRNQWSCGSCWAFGAAEAFGDRLCIASQGKVNKMLSPMDLVACDKTNYGCKGGMLDAAWKYMAEAGIRSNMCMPYTAALGLVQPCPKKCTIPLVSSRKYNVDASTIVYPGDAAAIQQEIMTNGPVEAGFTVYADFMHYKKGVYQHVTGAAQGGHAIKILGWGVESGTPYWLVANSWGKTWGSKGFFKIKRGSNESGIESNVVAGKPTADSLH